MRKAFKDSGFAKMCRIMDGNGFVFQRHNDRAYIYKRDSTVVIVPRSICEKDVRSMIRKYGLSV